MEIGNKEFNVLSLFDGCSGGQQALDRLGKKVDTYYASEIDKYAITVTMANYPNTIQLGSVTEVDVSKLKPIHLLCGGSPCQSFSFAGKRKGMAAKTPTKKQLSDLKDLKDGGYNIDDGEFLATMHIEILTLEHYLELKEQKFEFEGQSYLFWEYIRILTDIRKYNPDVKFLLENVIMGEKWQKILTRAIGINPIEINSSLVSAQNRRRLYWTNIGAEQDGLFGDLKCMIPQPKDRGILLKDILELEVADKYYLSEEVTNRFKEQIKGSNDIGTTSPDFRTIGQRDEVYGTEGKMGCLNATDYKQPKQIQIRHKDGKLKNNQDKASCFTAGGHSGGNHSDMDLIQIVAMRGRNQENPKSRKTGLSTEQMLEPRNPNDGKTNCITTVQKDNLVYTANNLQYGDGYALDNRAYYEDGKQGTLDTKPNRAKTLLNTSRIRRLTPTECERLQCMTDFYTAHVSDSQRYKMIGNGWTISVISHIFSYLDK